MATAVPMHRGKYNSRCRLPLATTGTPSYLSVPGLLVLPVTYLALGCLAEECLSIRHLRGQPGERWPVVALGGGLSAFQGRFYRNVTPIP